MPTILLFIIPVFFYGFANGDEEAGGEIKKYYEQLRVSSTII